jgi:hypothetical protein
MLRNGCSALAVALCLWSNPLRADFVISFDVNTQIAPGSTGFVNAYISSTTPGGQTLSQTSFEFALSTTGGTRLEFTNSPPPSSDPTFTNPNYVFAGNSFSQSNGFPLGTSQTASAPNDRFAGGDFQADFGFTVVDATPKLIAMVPITTVTGLPPVLGDAFTISLVPSSGAGFSGQTGFFDALGFGQPFTSGTGTITITGITASPEPSALILVGTGVGLSWLAGRRRGRAAPTTP